MNGLTSQPCKARLPHKHAKHRFIYFSQNTEGRCGRPVYIDAGLLADFLIAVDIASHGGLEVVKQIEQLRALGGGIHSHQSKDNARQHKSLFGKVEVHYYIAQEDFGGVFITKIGGIAGHTGKSGLYRIISDEVYQHPSDFFATEQGCIGTDATVEDLAKTASAYLAKSASDTIAYDLFFTPSEVLDQHGCWITPTQKTLSESGSATALAKAMEKTQKFLSKTNKQTLRILVTSNTNRVLEESLKLVEGQLDRLSFEFVERENSSPTLLNQLALKKAEHSRPRVQVTPRNSLMALAKVRHQIAVALKDIDKSGTATEVRLQPKLPNATLATVSAPDHHKNNFMTATRQASLLSKWQS